MIIFKGTALQYVALCSGSIAVISSGFHLGWTGPFLPRLFSDEFSFQVSHDEGSWIAISFLLGGFCGAGLSCVLLDKIGRKRLIVFSNLPFFLSWVLVALARNVWYLYVGRFIAGISDGIIFCALPLYFSEIADASVRGFFVSCLTFTQLIGILLMGVLGAYCSMQTVSLIGLTIPLLVLFTFVWLPDTPHYYVVQGQLDCAMESLQYFSGNSDVQLDRILKTAIACGSKNKLLNFFTNKQSAKGICILLIVRTVQQFSGYLAFTFYLPVIFKSADEFVSPVTSSCIYYTLQITTALISTIIIDKVGRKPLLLLSVLGSAISLALAGVFFALKNVRFIDLKEFSWIPLVGLLLFIVSYSLGLCSIPLLYAGEFFPIGVKVLGVAGIEMYYCVISSVASKFFQYTKDEFGMHVPFLAFAAICTCSLPLIQCFVPETKNKSLEEIQIEHK